MRHLDYAVFGCAWAAAVVVVLVAIAMFAVPALACLVGWC